MTNEPPPAPLNRRLGYQLKRAQHALRLRMDEHLADLALTTPQYAVLANLKQTPGLSNAELARQAFVAPQTMIRIVTGLQQKELIDRQPSSENRRILQAALTPKGRRLVDRADILVGQVEQELREGISESETLQIITQLSQMTDNLGNE